MKIILVRHGLTQANIKRIYSTNDTILDQSGYKVLTKTRQNLNRYDISKVYTSGLIRSQQTAKMLGFEDFTIDPRINEIDFGNFKGMGYDEVREVYKDFFDTFSKDSLNTAYPGGESKKDLIARTSDFLDEISKNKGDILCISHGIAIRSTLFWVLKDLGNWDNFWLDNGSITVYNVNNHKKVIETLNLV